ncbi:MAG: hypothetical protein A2X46_17210 [Lentisphaerae bacterium GWF2_57_35]|nr:MAG: hypothetical protein A2X46_17210 [Lentisphaerae bacterium GWF2_57_35]
MGGLYARQYYTLPHRLPSDDSNRKAFAWPVSQEPPAEIWTVFAPPANRQAAAAEGPLAQRFRLAGTFFSYSESSATAPKPECRAILDDLQKQQQYLVREGDWFEAVRVNRIYSDRVTVDYQGREEDLWLSFAGGPGPQKTEPAPAEKTVEDGVALETSRFGKRVGENRWVFQREDLLKYYQELLDDPERMASIFLSMKPDYQEGRINGYHVDVEGEKDFFKDVGLQQGDVVRKVNSMKMTSQARAEYFLGEFVKNRVSAVVMEVEREGKPQKLIYLFR